MPRDQNRGRKKRQRRGRQQPPKKKGGSQKVDAQVLPPEAVGPGADTGQGGENGAPAPGPGRSIPGEVGGEAVGPPDPVGTRPVSPPRPPSNIPRPYRLTGVTDAEIALQFSEWCRTQGGKTLGIHVISGYIGIADQEVGWQIRPGNDLVGQVSEGGIKHLLGSEGPTLVCQDTPSVIPELAALLQLPIRPLLGLVKGDIASLNQVLGRPQGHPHWTSAADAAYDAAAQQKQWAKGAPQFYDSVAVVRAKQHTMSLHENANGVPFTIIFDDLLPRVIAHFSQDPTLIAAFRDGEDIVQAITSRLPGVEGRELAVLFWAAMGCEPASWDEVLRYSGQQATTEALEEMVPAVQKAFPTLHLSYINQREDYGRERLLSTLYGNPVKYGLTPGEAIARRILWSVGEVPNVVASAFWNDPEIQVREITGQDQPFLRQHMVKGFVDGEEKEWRPVLEQVSQAVGSHMVVGAKTSVIWGT